jgi:adenylosuccinate synthase
VIFESAQGALLDRRYGFYPYITKTSCDYKNAITLLKETKQEYNLTRIGIIVI